MSDDLEGFLTAYVRAFETLDPDGLVPFYQLPCVFIATQNTTVAADAATARAVVAYLMEHARRQGYRRTEIRHLWSRRLSADLALLSGVYVRFDAGDEEIARFGFTYIVRSEAGKWKIAVAVAHDVIASEAS